MPNAQESVGELVDKPTTHTWAEEAAALQVLRTAARNMRVICALLKLTTMKNRLLQAEAQADAIASSIPSSTSKRPACRFLLLLGLCAFVSSYFID